MSFGSRPPPSAASATSAPPVHVPDGWRYWLRIDEHDVKGSVKSLLCRWPNQHLDALASQYLVFITYDLHRFLVSHSIARLCSALTELLDDIDAEPTLTGGVTGAANAAALASRQQSGGPPGPARSPSQKEEFEVLDINGILEATPSFELDDTSADTLTAVLEYLEHCVDTANPTVLARPLLGPLHDAIRNWEWDFLQTHGSLLAPTRRGTEEGNTEPHSAEELYAEQKATRKRSSTGDDKAQREPFAEDDKELPTSQRSGDFERSTAQQLGNEVRLDIKNGTMCATENIPPLLLLMRAADFLQIDSLRDLTCAYLASMVMTQTEQEFAKTIGLDRPLMTNELAPIYRRFNFLQTPDMAKKSGIGLPEAPKRATPPQSKKEGETTTPQKKNSKMAKGGDKDDVEMKDSQSTTGTPAKKR